MTSDLEGLTLLQSPRNNSVRDENEVFDDEEPPTRQHVAIQNDVIVKILEFRGASSLEELLEWDMCVEKISEYFEYLDTQKCQLIALEFRDYANLW